MNIHQARTEVMQEIMAEMKFQIDTLISRIDVQLEATEARIDTGQEPTEAESKTGLEAVKATNLEANLEEIDAVAKNQEVPNEETAVETVGALKDRSGDRRLAARRRGRFTCRAVPARHKGRSHKGPTVEKRRREQQNCNAGIRYRGLTQQLRQGNKGNVNETLRGIVVLAVVKLAAGSSVGFPKMIVKTLWRSRPQPKRKKRRGRDVGAPAALG
jgi:hypothetical protein